MFHEYALDPAVLTNWKDVRYFLDAFGPAKGRFLAQYPKNWKKRVHQALSCKPVEKLRCIERLSRLDRRTLVRRSGGYDGEKAWLENARAEHARLAFRAIVAAVDENEGAVLASEDIDEDVPLWRVDPGALIERHEETYARALAVLLRVSKRVVLIDPYFRADRHERRRALVALCGFIDAARTEIEVHWSSQSPGMPSPQAMVREARNKLPKLVPEGLKVTLRCWNERPNGPRIHNRYLVTDRGGVQFGDSVEHDDAGTRDRISILDDASWRELWKDYASDEPAFQEAGVAEVIIGAA